MAIYQAGYLSPIKNKLGGAVGRRWRTLNVLAVYNGNPRNPRTSAQTAVRNTFRALAQLAQRFSVAAQIGFSNLCAGTPIPQRSMFIRKNYSRVNVTAAGVATIDYEDFEISSGDLPEIQFGAPDFEGPLQIDIPINDSASVAGTHRDDVAYVFVYSVNAKAGILSDSGKRVDEEISINVPAYWVGHQVHVYGFGKGSDQNTLNAGEFSKTCYLGSGTIS